MDEQPSAIEQIIAGIAFGVDQGIRVYSTVTGRQEPVSDAAVTIGPSGVRVGNQGPLILVLGVVLLVVILK